MSREFASIMEAISGDTVDEKIKAFSDVLDKITQFAVNSIDHLAKRIGQLEGKLQELQGRITILEQHPGAVTSVSAPGVPPPIPSPVTSGPAAPQSTPKPTSPMSARAALQSELKALFNKRKQG
ncbi:MAG: hypothetical protein ACFFD2_12355 [Promethearchaeota archaeon]